MTDRRPYTYVLLRYRHDPLAGEFANVGVVLHEPRTGFVAARVRKSLGRLAYMFPGMGREAFVSATRAVERGVRKLAEQNDALFSLEGDAGRIAAHVLPRDDSSFVWGDVGSGLTADPERTLDNLYERFVTRYDGKAKASRDDSAIWKPVRDLLLQRQIADKLHAVTIRSPLNEVEFDHAWKNGAWHCYQPLSFDLSTGEYIREKASRWAGQLLALHESTEAFRAHFVVGAPRNPKLKADYERAIGILRLGPGSPEVIEETSIGQMVDEIEDEIRAHAAEQLS